LEDGKKDMEKINKRANILKSNKNTPVAQIRGLEEQHHSRLDDSVSNSNSIPDSFVDEPEPALPL